MVKWLSIVIIVFALLFVNYNLIDLKEATIYYGNLISQNYPTVGVIVFFILLLFFVLPKETSNYWNRLKSKVKIKEKF